MHILSYISLERYSREAMQFFTYIHLEIAHEWEDILQLLVLQSIPNRTDELSHIQPYLGWGI